MKSREREEKVTIGKPQKAKLLKLFSLKNLLLFILFTGDMCVETYGFQIKGF